VNPGPWRSRLTGRPYALDAGRAERGFWWELRRLANAASWGEMRGAMRKPGTAVSQAGEERDERERLRLSGGGP
jgi:hypothetical protein